MHTASAEEHDIVGEVERLLEAAPPATTEPEEFWAEQFDRGLAWVHFTPGEGGMGVSPQLQRVVDEVLGRAGAPENFARNGIGVGMAAPVLQTFADAEVRRRSLRRIWTCEDIWCQLFSEPGAGSDLASLATRATVDGDEWVVTGQKVWTTLAHVARWGLLLARTDPSAPKHEGLTYFILDMQAPGVHVRPLRQITGETEFNEVYLDQVRIPDAMRLGEVGDGWRVAVTTLLNERNAIGAAGAGEQGDGPIAQVLELWHRHGGDTVMRDRVARAWIEAEVVRLTLVRAQQARAAGTPGAGGSTGKLAATEAAQRAYELCIDLMGLDGLLVGYDETARPTTIGLESSGEIPRDFLRSRAKTIEGGSSEIMRNILAERILGLPGDVRVDKGIPWSEVPRS